MTIESMTFPKQMRPRAIRSLADQKAHEVKHMRKLKTDKEYAWLATQNAELNNRIKQLEAENEKLKAKKGK